MYKFITVKCRSCNSVIYNLPEKDFKKLRLINLTCEDCRDHSTSESFRMETKKLVIPKNMQVI
jgi:hypothetical protein